MARTRSSALSELPEGFSYQPGFLTEAEETELLRRFRELPFQPFVFQGYTAKRRVVDYGLHYDFVSREASATASVPAFLAPLRERAAAHIGVESREVAEALITEYPPGAPIGWHRDVPQFEVVIGISLGSACRMRLKPYRGAGKLVSVVLEPRSIYVMRGLARWQFQHSIPAVEQLRYSITFRTLRARKRTRDAA